MMEPHLDALARVIVAALAPSKPALRKRCHPGSSSLAFELSLRSGRCAYYRDALTGVERLAVACCAAEVGDVNVYDLTAASKFRVLRETAEGEGSKKFDPQRRGQLNPQRAIELVFAKRRVWWNAARIAKRRDES